MIHFTFTSNLLKCLRGFQYFRYCTDINGTEKCDQYFSDNNVSLIRAIPGIASGVISSETPVD